MSRLYQQLETERNTGLKMLGALDRGALLALVPPRGETLKNRSKPEKVYCAFGSVDALRVQFRRRFGMSMRTWRRLQIVA